MDNIINAVLHSRDEYCSELFDLWNELWNLSGNDKNQALLMLEGHFNTAHGKQNVKQMIVYIQELLFHYKKNGIIKP